MKTLLLLIALVSTGCTVTEIETPTMKLHRVSFFQKVEIPQLTMNTNGAITLEGYGNDGGTGAAAAITAAAVSAAMKSAAP